jgi:hypothetical protein
MLSLANVAGAMYAVKGLMILLFPYLPKVNRNHSTIRNSKDGHSSPVTDGVAQAWDEKIP